MEEILQSIRKIIAEDDTAPKDAAAKPSEPDEPGGSDVLELTEVVKEDGTPVSAAPEAPSADILNQIDQALTVEKPVEKQAEKPVEPVAAKPPEPEKPAVAATPAPVAPPAAAVAPAPAEPLMAEAPAAAVADTFKNLRNKEDPLPPLVTTPAPAFRSGLTVEDMVTDMLRPMMKDWLDNNLPAIVERIVEREVRRLTK